MSIGLNLLLGVCGIVVLLVIVLTCVVFYVIALLIASMRMLVALPKWVMGRTS